MCLSEEEGCTKRKKIYASQSKSQSEIKKRKKKGEKKEKQRGEKGEKKEK